MRRRTHSLPTSFRGEPPEDRIFECALAEKSELTAPALRTGKPACDGRRRP
jgi:hypothetical protein